MVLEIIARHHEAGVTEIAKELGVHKSTVSRLVAVLEARGFVEQVCERGKYRIGTSIARLAGSAATRPDLVKQGQSACDELSERVGETTTLAVLSGDRTINIAEARGRSAIALRTWIGQSGPAHAGASGKVLLAGLECNELRRLLPPELTAFTPNTVVRRDELESELAEIRRRGWAGACAELEAGLNGVAAAVYDDSANTVAALCVSGPAYRLGAERFGEIAAATVIVASRISRRLGFVG